MRDVLENPNKRFLSIPEVCEILGVGRSSIYKLRERGDLKFVKVLDRAMVSRTEVERFIASLEAGEAAA